MTQDEVLVFKSFQYFKSRFVVEGVEDRQDPEKRCGKHIDGKVVVAFGVL